MRSVLKKTAEVIIESGNDYLGALKGNQSGLLAGVKANFQALLNLRMNSLKRKHLYGPLNTPILGDFEL
ncbi:MAG: hypothetical protein F6K19_37800 [Cyanothece sp. SIO1E1]|nr:hypothetical protein [Cyanothece sp. SIO1E1]